MSTAHTPGDAASEQAGVTHTFETKAWLSDNSSVGPADLQAGRRLDELSLSDSNMKAYGWTFVGVAQVTLLVPSTQELVAAKVDALKGELSTLRADFHVQEKGLETKLQNLLAITNEAAS